MPEEKTTVIDATNPPAEGALPELPHAWMNGLTTEQKADADLIKSVSKFKRGVPDLVGSYAALEKKQSQSVSVPNETATEEEKARYRKAIGVPEKSEDYKLGEVELPEDLTIDELMQKGFLETAHSLDLNNDQASKLYQWHMEKFVEQIADARLIVKTTKAEAMAAGQKKHGADWGAAQTYFERAMADFANPAVKALFERTGIGNEPGVIDFFVNLGKATNDHPFVDGSRGEHLETSTLGNRTDAEIAKTVYGEKEGR